MERRYRDKLTMDSVVVLESLPAGERLTGRWLFDNVLTPWTEANEGNTAQYSAINDKPAFLGALDSIRVDYFLQGRIPILQIEAHGTPKGLKLANGDFVTWEEMRGHFTEMNRLSGCNLFVVMSACSGWHLASILTPTQTAPAWGILGPYQPIGDKTLQNAMQAFYSELLTSYDAIRAIRRMNNDLPRNRWLFDILTAEMMFFKAFTHYLEVHCTEAQLTQRENEMVAAFHSAHGFDMEATYTARAFARSVLQNVEKHFEYYRETFLMLDNPPSNRDRFKLSYSDCKAFATPQVGPSPDPIPHGLGDA